MRGVKRNFTDEEIEGICDMYAKPEEYSVRDIMDKYNMRNARRLVEIVEANGLPRRHVARVRDLSKSESRAHVCSKCHKPIDNPNARFCWYCGADVRTPKMAAIEALDRCVLGNLELVTPAVRDEMAEAVRFAIKLLKEE